MSPAIHQDQPVIHAGVPLEEARRAVILLHGRGAAAESMLPLAEALGGDGTAFLIPQAARNRWYPETAFGPLEPNQPDLSSALEVIADLVGEASTAGLSRQEILLGGFSQGACLAAEYLVRNPERYGGLFVFSGALIGPPGQNRVREGDLQETPVLIGGGDVDHWVTGELFQEAAEVFQYLNAVVDLQIYPGMGHTVNQDEINRVKSMIAAVNNDQG